MHYEELIRLAIEQNASDIHIAPNSKPLFRINGSLIECSEYELLTHNLVFEFIGLLCDSNRIKTLEDKGELNFSFSIKTLGRFRINIVKQRGTYSIAIRILKLIVPSRDTLGIPEVIFKNASLGKGLIIVSGASGSGRSTTMAAIIQFLNETQKLHIITVESPIEYLLKHDKSLIIQRDIGTDCESVYEGVKSIMRHDPDVVMISDLVDDSIIDLALQISESGKLVIAGMSTINARSTIDNIISSTKPEKASARRLRLTSTLLAIISQQLVPNVDMSERLLVYELLLSNAAIKSHILTGNLVEVQNTLTVGKKHGMYSMDNILYERFQKGEITKDTLYRFCQDLEFIKRLERLQNSGEK